jgi:DNA-binding NarL/FixJ family response regulator
VARHQPDACLLDFRFHEGGEGLGAARAIRDQYPDTAVLVVSGPGGQLTPLAAAQIGVAGFFGKDQELDKIAIALDTIAAGRVASPPEPPVQDRLSALTPRETEVLHRIAAGQSTRTMAREMTVTTETLRTYVKNVLGKLGAHSRLEAAALASRAGPAGQAEPEGEHPLLAALTPREREVLAHLTEGAGLREVAKRLHMSVKTINTHLHNLRGKLGVHSTLEAVALARFRPGRPSGRPLAEQSGQHPDGPI